MNLVFDSAILIIEDSSIEPEKMKLPIINNQMNKQLVSNRLPVCIHLIYK